MRYYLVQDIDTLEYRIFPTTYQTQIGALVDMGNGTCKVLQKLEKTIYDEEIIDLKTDSTTESNKVLY